MKRLVPVFVLGLALCAAPSWAKNEKAKSGELPPGLQKNAERGKPLPPGWEKKIHRGAILEPDIFDHASIVKAVDPFGLITVRIEGKLLRLHEKTHEIIEILHD